MLENLKPAGFFKWFEAITRIPHGSGHEEKIAAFLEKNGGSIVKTIVVKNKLVNLIVK